MKKIVVALFVLSLTLTACGSAKPKGPTAEQIAQEVNAASKLAAFKTSLDQAETPDEIHALYSNTTQYSTEWKLSRAKLDAVVVPLLKKAQSLSEVRDLKKYAPYGTKSIIAYSRAERRFLSTPQGNGS